MWHSHFMSFAFGLLITAVCVSIYLLPTLIAIAQRRHDIVGIFLLNLFLGWTLIVWAGVLIWACIMPASSVHKSNNTPIDIARRRYASGEITFAELEEITKNLA